MNCLDESNPDTKPDEAPRIQPMTPEQVAAFVGAFCASAAEVDDLVTAAQKFARQARRLPGQAPHVLTFTLDTLRRRASPDVLDNLNAADTGDVG